MEHKAYQEAAPPPPPPLLPVWFVVHEPIIEWKSPVWSAVKQRQSTQPQPLPNQTPPATAMSGGDAALVQQSAAQIISGPHSSCSSTRSALFLLPRADGACPPSLPSRPREPAPALCGGPRAEFKGWAGSPKLWRRWLAKLRPRHEQLWREVGILGGVLATAYRVLRRDEAALLQLAAFWSGGTNTFIFPWGEATVTLEDVAALAGLPLLGCPVRAGLPADLEKEVGELEVARILQNQTKKKKESYAGWVKHFLDRTLEKGVSAAGGGNPCELVEHGAFLSMWLSLFVFPAPPFNVVRPEVFPLAVRLARGQRMALAPAALASIYKDLSALKHHISLGSANEQFVVSAPMHILQLWLWEHFPELRPETPSSPDPDDCDVPRVARWHDVGKGFNPKYVHAVFISPKEFEWRPYGSSSFALPPETSGCLVHGQDVGTSDVLLSFVRCLQSCELVGMMDCIQKYRPHRVARQLGFDQDVPGTVARVNFSKSRWKKAWDTYNIETESFTFVVPNHKPGVTVEYVRWWEPFSSACASAVANAAQLKEVISVRPVKRKMEELPAANSGKKLHMDTATGMPHPATDAADDLLDFIPLVVRLNSIRKMTTKQHTAEDLLKSTEQENSANAGAKKPHRNVEQFLSNVAAGFSSILGESGGAITTKVQGKYLQQNKEDLVIANEEEESKSKHDIVLYQNVVQDALSTGSNEGIRTTAEADMLPTCESVLVMSDHESGQARGQEYEVSALHLKSPTLQTKTSSVREGNGETQLVGANNDTNSQLLREVIVLSSDDESDKATSKEDEMFEEETKKDDMMGTMHLKSPKMETTQSMLQEPNEKRQLVSKRNDEQGNPMLKDFLVQSNRNSEHATVLDVATDQSDVGLLERPPEEVQRCFSAGEIDDRDKEYKEDPIDTNRDSSVISERSSSRLVNGITEPDSSFICTKTLYYLSSFDLPKKTRSKDANSAGTYQDVYLPRRAVGTMEMIKKASAIRQAEIAELKKAIGNLKEEILLLEAAEGRKHLKKVK